MERERGSDDEAEDEDVVKDDVEGDKEESIEEVMKEFEVLCGVEDVWWLREFLVIFGVTRRS